MAKQRYINTRFWDDGYITTLDPIEKLLFIYFLTNPLTELSGAYEIPLRRIAFDTGIDRDMVVKIVSRFAEANKIIYRDGWVLVCNFIRHQSPSPKIAAAIETSLSRCPDWVKDRVSNPIDTLSHLNLNRDSNRDSNTPAPTQDPPEPKESDAQTIFIASLVSRVRAALGVVQLGVTNTREWENAALVAFRNGFTVDEFIACFTKMRNEKKYTIKPEWVNDQLPDFTKRNKKGDDLPTREEKIFDRENAKVLFRAPQCTT